MEIKTKRLILSPVKEDDWRDLKAIFDGLRPLPYAKYDKPHPTDDADIKARAARWEAFGQSMAHLFFGVRLDGRMIGYVVFHEREPRVYECGYSFNPAFHGQGYAGESCRALIQWMKDNGAARITAGTALNNKPSVKLLTSLGFELVGTERVSFYKDEHGEDIFFDGGLFELTL